MVKLSDNSRVYGSLFVDRTVVAGAGALQSISVLTSSSGTFTIPTAAQSPGVILKCTIVGAGGGGGGTAASTAAQGSGGGSGSIIIAYISVIAGLYSFTYTVGTAGTAGTGGASPTAGGDGASSSIVYNGVTYLAYGGLGGSISSVQTPGLGGTPSIAVEIQNRTVLYNGYTGGIGGAQAAANFRYPKGADTPLFLGRGGIMPSTAAGANGLNGQGYGSGGGGGMNGTTATARNGGAGASGVIIVEY